MARSEDFEFSGSRATKGAEIHDGEVVGLLLKIADQALKRKERAVAEALICAVYAVFDAL